MPGNLARVLCLSVEGVLTRDRSNLRIAAAVSLKPGGRAAQACVLARFLTLEGEFRPRFVGLWGSLNDLDASVFTYLGQVNFKV